MRRIVERLEELNVEQKDVLVVYKDGHRKNSIFSAVYRDDDGRHYLKLYSAIFMGEGSKLDNETYEVPAHEIGYLYFPKIDKKISMMPFHGPAGG